jgi:hypothetical protein
MAPPVKETKGVAGVPWRFEPLSKDAAGADPTEIGEDRGESRKRDETRNREEDHLQETISKPIAPWAVSRYGARTRRRSVGGHRPRWSTRGRRLLGGLAVSRKKASARIASAPLRIRKEAPRSRGFREPRLWDRPAVGREQAGNGLASAAPSRNGTRKLSLRRPRVSARGRRLRGGLAVGREKIGVGLAALASVSRKGAWAPLGSPRGRLLWGGLAVVLLLPLVVLVAARSSGDEGDPSPERAAPPPAAVSIQPSNEPQKAIKAQTARKADRNSAPAASPEESSAQGDESDESNESGSDGGPSSFGESQSPSPPAPAPPPESSGGQSEDPPPDILHGIEVGGP